MLKLRRVEPVKTYLKCRRWFDNRTTLQRALGLPARLVVVLQIRNISFPSPAVQRASHAKVLKESPQRRHRAQVLDVDSDETFAALRTLSRRGFSKHHLDATLMEHVAARLQKNGVVVGQNEVQADAALEFFPSLLQRRGIGSIFGFNRLFFGDGEAAFGSGHNFGNGEVMRVFEVV